MRRIKQKDTITALGVSPATGKILRYFLLRPKAAPHGRELQRTLDLSGSSLDRELRRLVDLGVLERKRRGNRVQYSADFTLRLWTAFRILTEQGTDPSKVIEEAMADVDGVTGAFLFGSTARGEDRADSDIDVFVLEGPEVDRRALLSQLAEAGILLGREVNVVRYSPEKLARRLGDPEHPGAGFVRQTLTGPKQWIGGNPEVLRHLSLAAGLDVGLERGS